jgi:hypothetical protein
MSAFLPGPLSRYERFPENMISSDLFFNESECPNESLRNLLNGSIERICEIEVINEAADDDLSEEGDSSIIMATIDQWVTNSKKLLSKRDSVETFENLCTFVIKGLAILLLIKAIFLGSFMWAAYYLVYTLVALLLANLIRSITVAYLTNKNKVMIRKIYQQLTELLRRKDLSKHEKAQIKIYIEQLEFVKAMNNNTNFTEADADEAGL